MSVASLARHNELIVEGVKSVMVGKILNIWSKGYLEQGRQESRSVGDAGHLFWVRMFK